MRYLTTISNLRPENSEIRVSDSSTERIGFLVVDDFDEDDEDAWAVHNSQGWYLAIFGIGVAVAALIVYLCP